MLDIKFIRQNIDLVKSALENRGAAVSLDELLEADARRRELIQEADELKARRNQFSTRIAKSRTKVGSREEKARG